MGIWGSTHTYDMHYLLTSQLNLHDHAPKNIIK